MGGHGMLFLQALSVHLPFRGGVKWELACGFNPIRSGTKFNPSYTSRLGGNLRAHLPCILSLWIPPYTQLGGCRVQRPERIGEEPLRVCWENCLSASPLSCAWDPRSWSDLFLWDSRGTRLLKLQDLGSADQNQTAPY